MSDARNARQDKVIAFLGAPSSYGPAPPQVERIDTHGAIVFLAGDQAYKIKRAVRFSYLDFSTLEKRRRACEGEVEINRLTAPGIYLGLVAITRDHDGLSGLARVVSGTTTSFAEASDVLNGSDVAEYSSTIRAALANASELLRRRTQKGLVRRCHGDLHLRNIVMLDGAPVLFDAIEFDETIATIDILYDLAFLLMDLWHRGDRPHANALLNRYLWRKGALDNIEGLATLPLFLSLRAAIRAMVTVDRLPHLAADERTRAAEEAREYFELAREFLAPSRPRLIAVGGLSGTGKSTLAAGLAPSIGAAPGAFHLRSDVERKLLFGAEPEEPLDASCYSEDVTQRVYATLNEKAVAALAAGHSVIVDAVFARADQRAAAALVAEEAGGAFSSLWLTAPEAQLIERVEKRSGDASDADVSVVKKQLGYEPGEIAWRQLDAGGTRGRVRDAAASQLDIEI